MQGEIKTGMDSGPLPEIRDIFRAPRPYFRLISERLLRSLRERDTKPGSLILVVFAGMLTMLLLYWTALVAQIPAVGELEDTHFSEASIAYTADGLELTRYHIENRTPVPLDSIARPVLDALIATEDHRFLRHAGVDVARIFGAIMGTAGGDPQGGSTITMQLARNIYPGIRNDWILSRKIKEWLTAVRLEDNYSKDEILEMYLNAVPFMYEAVGIEAAARTYFQKPASQLNLLEGATLVGMLKATYYYNPVRYPDRSHVRRNTVLQQMVRHGYLTQAAYESLREQETELNFRRMTRHANRAPYFAEYVRQWLDEWAEETGHNLYTDGLRIHTTLDSRLQSAAELAVAEVMDELQRVVDVDWSSRNPFASQNASAYTPEHEKIEPFSYFWQTNVPLLREAVQESDQYRRFIADGMSRDSALALVLQDTVLTDSLKQAYQRLETGFVALDPTNGEVKAWVGGREFKEREYDHVALAKRQPGSTFKPFVYAAALENGYAPSSLVADQVRNYVDPYTGVRWTPRNFGGVSGRLMTLRQGLALSKNTITAQLITDIGPDKVVNIARNMGIQSTLQAVPSLGLGTSEVSLLELAGAYGSFANLGAHYDPILVTRIEDRNGRVLATFSSPKEQALPAHTAYAVLDMMRGGIDYGTAVRLRSMFGAKGDLAGKTGTTQNGADGWFMLLHPRLVAGAWVGFRSPKVTFRSQYWGQGAHNALHVVGNFYQHAQNLRSEYLSVSASFKKGPDHKWGSRGRMTADDLTRREREQNRLGTVLEQLRKHKAAN